MNEGNEAKDTTLPESVVIKVEGTEQKDTNQLTKFSDTPVGRFFESLVTEEGKLKSLVENPRGKNKEKNC